MKDYEDDTFLCFYLLIFILQKEMLFGIFNFNAYLKIKL